MLCEISEDSDQLEETYGEWLAHAEKSLKNIIAQGVFPEKILLIIDSKYIHQNFLAMFCMLE